MEALLQWDLQWFTIINQNWSTPWLDAMMPMWRNKFFWIPLYAFILLLVGINYPKKVFMFILATVFTVLISDMTSSQIIKESVQRERPCRVIGLRSTTLVPCGSGYSFTSSHAANHMALATFWYLTLRGIFFGIGFPLFLWALSIGYAQIYVGVHYPLDVIAGGLLGAFVGVMTAYIYHQFPEYGLNEAEAASQIGENSPAA